MPASSKGKRKLDCAPVKNETYVEIPANQIVKGDVILTFSRRKIQPTRVKVTSAMTFDDGVHLKMGNRREILPPRALIKVPKI